ncbi:MAG: carboxylesterase family protein [Saprospiraceae bacterium]|nr:carboxylesterase family protein [Saprospiraceae bacterium]MDW8484083.1 alpha/beta hydrolase [Saprospiraceae bacterium]
MRKTLFAVACLFSTFWIPVLAQPPFEPLFGPIVLSNVVYGKALNYNNREIALTLDVYIPAFGRQSRFPLLVVVHGGGFIAGDRREMQGIVHHFASRGYVVANVSYRLGFINTRTDKNCNGFPSYACAFAADSVEWIRAWYRGVQDVKGAIRYLTNRAEIFKIDPERVFLLGESAGGFIVYGVAFLDTDEEKPVFAGKQNALPIPAAELRAKCAHYTGQTFSSDSIQRPDLGGIEGSIEWPGNPYTIRGIANIYGGMYADLLERRPLGKHKPAIYQFHRGCDIIVPFEYNRLYFGFSWCVANCWGCEYVFHTPHVFGSKKISDWNQQRGYGYVFKNDFTTLAFPFACIDLFAQHHCLAQVNEPCHSTLGFDVRKVEEFFRQQSFAPEVTAERVVEEGSERKAIALGPNPFAHVLYVQNTTASEINYWITGVHGWTLREGVISPGEQIALPTQTWPQGVYFFHAQTTQRSRYWVEKIIKFE